MSLFQIHKGTSALSDANRERLASKIGAQDIVAEYIHYIALNDPLDEKDSQNLNFLLDYNDIPPNVRVVKQKSTSKTSTFYVSPRLGTISPWSSQATACAQVCGLSKVKRIERGIVYHVTTEDTISGMPSWNHHLWDRMTQTISRNEPSLESIFAQNSPKSATRIPLLESLDPRKELEVANHIYGMALDSAEIDYLVNAYGKDGPLKRDPYLEEVFMFAQMNSDHCRHKNFSAQWVINGEQKNLSLFEMIRHTHKTSPNYTVSAYSDNAAVLEGAEGSYLAPDWETGIYMASKEKIHFTAKVETHNHPTCISPFEGAATGAGGELRDEGSVGRGSKPGLAGMVGFAVSDLHIPGFAQPWELTDVGKPDHIASSLDIMLEAPVGAATYNNEFGRPSTCGFFRTLTTRIVGNGKSEIRGYHKPIMIAGGIGTVRPELALKEKGLVKPGDVLVVLGGPALLIGLGGGAASSIASHDDNSELDFQSVQRSNSEVQRRAQEVINTCCSMGQNSPILFIHDVGAGGLSNAMPELLHDVARGGVLELRDIDSADPSLSPVELFANESQERYVLAVAQDKLDLFKKIAERERCGYSIVGRTTSEQRLTVLDRDSKDHPDPINLPLSVLFDKIPRAKKVAISRERKLAPFDSSLRQYLPQTSTDGLLQEAVHRVLALPAVGSKQCFITIGDRTVGGKTIRDPMVGRYQVPVGDCAVAATSLTPGIRTGEAMSLGEKPTLALISPSASARMAVAEALMNIAAADLLGRTERIRLSANWNTAINHPGESAAIYEAVEAIAMQLAPALNISIPVGKDSMSLKMHWTDRETKEAKEVTAPLSLVITAFAPVRDIRNTWTPTLRRLEEVGETVILFVDLAAGRQNLGGSALAQVFKQVGNVPPDVHDVQLLRDYFDGIQQLHDMGIVLAYHDCSDGGLFTAVAEGMFAGRCGVELMIDGLCSSKNPAAIMEALFNEELGAVFQIREKDEMEFHKAFATCGPPKDMIKKIGRVPVKTKKELVIYHGNSVVYRANRGELQQRWAATSYHIQRLRDNPQCSEQEYAAILDDDDPGLSFHLTFSAKDSILPSMSTLMANMSLLAKPRVAVLRDQGVNGAEEMAAAFMWAGFVAVDVHTTDVLSGRVSLSAFVGLAAVGGFSWGDVLGAGNGWAKTILLSSHGRAEFKNFFERKDTFTLGVCNGCQMLSRLHSLIPGTEGWPVFEKNESEQFEARLSMVELIDMPGPGRPASVFLHGMAGSKLPIVSSHGEGRAKFQDDSHAQKLQDNGLVSMRFIDNNLKPTIRYPGNPSATPLGICGVRSQDGRTLALMPHPERCVLAGTGSWLPDDIKNEWTETGPWVRMFESARRWVG